MPSFRYTVSYTYMIRPWHSVGLHLDPKEPYWICACQSKRRCYAATEQICKHWWLVAILLRAKHLLQHFCHSKLTRAKWKVSNRGCADTKIHASQPLSCILCEHIK
eukprot:TRINITY_DN1078_c0_g1_i1.p2 TRINITY_DN1078_c0_g1~~TRINITY_DN1078_c0_g1_i1.p2  ORF type:complete len:106 (+),score=4.72 TRINITY_DN1078_c0_g1_i1:136-453(+)